MAKINLDELVDIAFAVEEGDPIDWSVFKDGKEQTIRMIGASILEQFDRETYSDQDRLIVMATITKLVVENFILHSKLLTQTQKDS
jgi:hypothetical protein